MQPYREYKETNLDWLPRVPTHWEVKRAKFVFKVINERSATGQEELLSVSHITGVTKRKENVTMFKAESYMGYKTCWPNDLVINSMWAWMGALGVAPLHGIVSTAYSVYRMDENQLFPAYANVLLRIKWYAQDFENRSKGVWTSRLMLSDDAFGNTLVIVPPIEEQKRIVSYLAAKNREIEGYIAAKRGLLVRLKELSAAVISRAVTRGLILDKELKPSGVEWLGDVPKHWEVKRLKFLSTKVGSGVTPKGGAQVYKQSGVPIIRSQNVHFDGLRLDDVAYIDAATHAEMANSQVKPGDVLLNITGASLGRVTSVPDVFGEANVNQHVCIIRPRNTISSVYLAGFLASDRIQRLIWENQNGASRQALTFDQIKDFVISLPPLDEQRAIVEFIEDKLATIREAQTRIEREIELARELYTTLVAEVVTGQIDVSSWEGNEDAALPLSALEVEDEPDEEEPVVFEEAM